MPRQANVTPVSLAHSRQSGPSLSPSSTLIKTPQRDAPKVGDNMQELRSYLFRTIAPRPFSAVSDLPPLWSSVLHADANF